MSASRPPSEESRLARRLGLGDAVVLGLGAMIGAGIFGALGPAAAAGGGALLIGLGVAGVVAFANAMASARLAAAIPTSGGTYAYGRALLSPFWGYLAGWGFVVGKLASLAAMALVLGAYAAPGAERPAAIAAVVAVVAVNYRGIERTAGVTRVIVAVVLACLAVVVAGALAGAGDGPGPGPLWPEGGARGVLESAGLLFFMFAGYARIATLGEEVRDPARTIPRAIPIALGVTLAVYALVAAAALAALGPAGVSGADAPLVEAARAGGVDALGAAARVGAAVASLGVLVSLVAGVSRTMFAMAAEGDLPRPLAAVHPRFRVPHRAEVTAGAAVIATVAVADLRGAIGFSAFAVLVYYGIANAGSLALPSRARWPRPLALVGMAGCALLAVTLPPPSVVAGAAVLAAGAAAYALRRATGGPRGARRRGTEA